MVKSELDSENGVCTGVDDVGNESLGPGIRRELSFSRWCEDDDERIHLDQQLGSGVVSLEEDSEFELPIPQKNELLSAASDRERFFHQKFRHSMQTNGIGTMDDDFVHRRGNGSEKYASFNIEDKSERGTNGVDSYISVADDDESLDKSSQNPIHVANILKTLFFILMWYTFSLFLTL